MGGCSLLQSPVFSCLLSKIYAQVEIKPPRFRRLRLRETAELAQLTSSFQLNAKKVVDHPTTFLFFFFFYLCYFFLYEVKHSEASSSGLGRALQERGGSLRGSTKVKIVRHGGNLRHMECTRDKGADLLKDKIKLKKGEGDERWAPPLEMGGLLDTSAAEPDGWN